MVKFPSKSETAPWFLSSTRIFTPDKGSPSSESVTKPEMFCACNPAQTTKKAIKKFKNDSSYQFNFLSPKFKNLRKNY
tara:strand:+ start:1300 stop:1533 length:234 start_codon:yes stop_codon:yes gene_type:complete